MSDNTMDTAAWKLLANILELAGDSFSNHSCNDYELTNTPENYALALEIEKRTGDPDEPAEVNVSNDGKNIYLMDWQVMSFFQDIAEEFAGESQ